MSQITPDKVIMAKRKNILAAKVFLVSKFISFWLVPLYNG